MEDSTSTPPSQRLEPGQVIDGFELIQRLHQGGMATLWEVRDIRPARPAGHGAHDTAGATPPALPLIMKVPRIRGGEDPAAIVGFEVEQMILPTLSGPHVPRYVAKGDFTRTPYIVMERIDGQSLRPRLDEAPLPIADVLDIGIRVSAALQSLHEQHVVHLDIKPSNIMIRTSGEAALVDFGLARHDDLPDLLEEEFTLPMGTGPYMSPEQVQFVRNDPRSDLFALGVMLYHLATGERPFGNPSNVPGLRKRLYMEPTPPSVLRPDMPPWMQEVILHCLEVQPEKRYQSAAQLLLDLQDPRQIQLTARGYKVRSGSTLKTVQRWFKALGAEAGESGSATDHLERGAIVMVAVDVQAAPELLAKLRGTVRRILQIETGARLACVGVMKTARIGMDQLLDKDGTSLHVKQLVQLKHWAHPLNQSLKLDEGSLTFHVLEAPDPAQAIIDFAKRNRVDHIVMGARGNSRMRRFLGSVSSQVAAQAECSVTVVRTAAGGGAEQSAAPGGGA